MRFFNRFALISPSVACVACFAGLLLAMMAGKLVFLICNRSLYDGVFASALSGGLLHGLSMDMSVSAYLSVIPLIWSLCAVWTRRGRMPDWIQVSYFAFVSLVLSLVFLLDGVLYSYWQFKLDATPLFYFFSSPSSAFASAETWQIVLLPVVWLVFAAILFCLVFAPLFCLCHIRRLHFRLGRGVRTVLLVLWGGVLFLCIRGGVTVSTMNPSRAYYSNDTRLNHAAVNPAFSLLYSLTHQYDAGSRHRYMDDGEAEAVFKSLTPVPSDSLTLRLVDAEKPDVHILLMESFSKHLFPSLGGENVALHLDSLMTSGGLVYDNIMASGTRTDRGIPAVLSGYPALTDNSIMRFVEKTDRLPSIASVLGEHGYDTEYYYGGDADFTNMKAFLRSAGISKLISDRDFPVSQRLSKWGAHDDVVFSRAAEDLDNSESGNPLFRVIQTSSSHEPFQIPQYSGIVRGSDRETAFAYADSCAADYIKRLQRSPRWNHTLIVVIPDHYGAYPEVKDPVGRHAIFMAFLGGALARRGVDRTPGSQTDLAATLLAGMGLDGSLGLFPFSRNLLNHGVPHFGFFTETSGFGFVTRDDTVVYNIETGRLESGRDENLAKARAYIQTLYKDFSER